MPGGLVERVNPIALAGALVMAVAACGGGHKTSVAAQVSPRSCLPSVAATAARSLSQPMVDITEATQVYAVVTCRYRVAKPSPTGCVGADVVLDMAPSAYERFERFVVERQQAFVQSGATHTDQAGVEIAGVGLEAMWVPVEHRLVATGGDRFASLAPDCPGAPSAELPLGQTLARAALRGAAALPPSRTGP